MQRAVAIVGRPNVGKSAMFNRLVGRRIAIVHEESGVTRDRLACEAAWGDHKFMLIDTGGIASIDGVSGEKLNNVGVGLTLGYTVNENLNMTVGYKSTVNDSDPTDLRMDNFMLTLVYGWHPLVEGARRLGE